jgi:regulator of replication initiation timing
MNCERVVQLIEEYVMKELDENIRLEIDRHLEKCVSCRNECSETKEVIDSLHGLKTSIKIKEDIMNRSKRNIIKKAEGNKKSVVRSIWGLAAGVFFILFVLSSSVIVFPTFASNYVPELPVVKQIKEVQAENSAVKQEMQGVKQENQKVKEENEIIKEENEKLKMTLKEIRGEEITEITTSDGIRATENNEIQELVIDFIKAQYREDIEAIKEMCTDEYRKQVEKDSSHIVGNKKGNVIFSTITNVAKEGELYLVFVRVNDDVDDDADYQWNFELKKIDGRFLVSFVGLDA